MIWFIIVSYSTKTSNNIVSTLSWWAGQEQLVEEKDSIANAITPGYDHKVTFYDLNPTAEHKIESYFKVADEEQNHLLRQSSHWLWEAILLFVK